MVPTVHPRRPESNIVALALPAHAPDTRQPFNRGFTATAAQAWQLQFELAWSYPRLWYTVWSNLMTLPPSRLPDR